MRIRTLLSFGAVAVLFVLFLAAERASFEGTGPPRRHPDTNVYMWKAEAPFFSEDFLLAGKPVATSLLYKLARRDETAIARVQSYLSVVCWFCLALAVAGELRYAAVRLAAVVSICLFSLTLIVNQWDYVLLSESLSFSMLVLALGASLALAHRLADPAETREGRLGLPLTLSWAAACFLLTLTRDANAYLVATLWGSFTLWLAIDAWRRYAGRRYAGRRSPRVHRGLLCAVVVLAPIVVSGFLVLRGSGRWQTPLVNVILQRVLTEPRVYEEWTARYGLPRNAVFERYAGKRAWTRTKAGAPVRDRLENRDPELENVRSWLTERGLSSYQRYLLWDRPARALERSFEAYAREVNSRYVERHFGKGAGRTRWTAKLSRWSYMRIPHPVWAWAAVLGAGAAFSVFVPPGRLLGLAGALAALSSWVLAFVNFHADTSNVSRHMVLCGTLLRLGVLFVALAALDHAFRLCRRPKEPESVRRVDGSSPSADDKSGRS